VQLVAAAAAGRAAQFVRVYLGLCQQLRPPRSGRQTNACRWATADRLAAGIGSAVTAGSRGDRVSRSRTPVRQPAATMQLAAAAAGGVLPDHLVQRRAGVQRVPGEEGTPKARRSVRAPPRPLCVLCCMVHPRVTRAMPASCIVASAAPAAVQVDEWQSEFQNEAIPIPTFPPSDDRCSRTPPERGLCCVVTAVGPCATRRPAPSACAGCGAE